MKTHQDQHAYIDGTRDRTAERLSPSQWRMLFDIRDSGDPRNSMTPAQGGAAGTLLKSLRSRGLVSGRQLTATGRKFLTVQWRES